MTLWAIRSRSKKMEEKLFWFTEAVNEASETNSIMNLSHILYVIADTKAPCTILYISGNIPIKTSRTPAQTLPPTPPTPSPRPLLPKLY